MQKTLFILLMLAGYCVSAQVDTFDFKGKKYLVYPYRVDNPKEEKVKKSWKFHLPRFHKRYVFEDEAYAEVYADNYVMENAPDYESNRQPFNGEIPPIFDSLPSGDYVLLQDPADTRENRRKKRHGKLFPIVRAEFSIANGKLNGKAILYLKSGGVDKEFYYVDGLKHGESRNIYFLDDTTYANITNYQMGVLNGPFKTFAQDNHGAFYLESEGAYKNGKQDGWYRQYDLNQKGPYLKEEYFIESERSFSKHYLSYYSNGQLKMESYPDSIAGYSEKNSPQYTRFIDSLNLVKTKKGEKIVSVYSSFYTEFNPTETPYVCYHKNGQLLGRFSYDSNNDLAFDTVFNSSGKPAIVKKSLADTNEHKRYSITYYSPDEKVTKRTLFASDSTGNWEDYQIEEMNYDGILELERADYEYLQKNNWRKSSTDSLILLSIKYHRGRLEYEYVSPLLGYQKFIRTQDKNTNYSIDFKITSYDTANAAYQTILTSGKGKAVLYTFRDTSAMASKRISSSKLFKKVLRTRNKNNFMDSLVMYYDGVPYTGALEIRAKGKAAFLTKKGDKLILNPLALSEKNLGYKKLFLKKSYLKAKIEDGKIKSANLKYKEGRKYIVAHCDFKNSLPHGKLYARKITKGRSYKKDETIEVFVNQGLFDGKMQNWAYDKKTKKRYLQTTSTFSNGMTIDTSITYYPDGKIKHISYFDKKGKANGANISYDEKGNIKEYAMYENGMLQGMRYSLNVIGDTVTVSNFINDTLEGPAYRMQMDYRTYKIKSKIFSNYKKGFLCGQFIYKDGFDIKRLVFNIDSSRSRYAGDNTRLINWDTKMCFSGEANIFHPNGKLYARGQMKMNPDAAPEDPSHFMLDVYEEGFLDTYDNYEEAPPALMNKSGHWDYYNSVGRKQVEIEYNVDTTYVLGKDTVSGMGYYKAFYDNGKLKYTGLLLYELPLENCESDLNEVDFVVDYKLYLSPNGDTLVKNGNGHMQTFNHDGGLSSEGEMKNFKKQGWWKEYNKEGKLISAGQYVDGMKNGRWLSGDLTGLNYLDGGCYQSEEIKAKIDKANKYNIEIVEVIYENDEQKSSQTYTFTRSVE